MKNIEVLGDGPLHDVVVVAFDMCSSSMIIEDLTRTNSLVQYDRLLKNLRLWLWSNTVASGFVLYKFTGDGWILLFPAAKLEGASFMKFLVRLARRHQELRCTLVDDHLESVPTAVGLTLGVEMGQVRKVVLGNETEFVGRAINVACRLQSAVKDAGPSPGYRCLVSRKVFNTYLKDLEGYTFGEAVRSLRNISGGERYRCLKVDLSLSF